jgi:hypothetical protein
MRPGPSHQSELRHQPSPTKVNDNTVPATGKHDNDIAAVAESGKRRNIHATTSPMASDTQYTTTSSFIPISLNVSVYYF